MISQLPFPLSPLKPCSSIAGKRIGESSNLGRFSPIPRFRLAARSVSWAETENDDGNNAMPKHVAVVMDGHGRWAKRRGLSVNDGHKNGVMNINNIASYFSNLGIKILTFYSFSTENWNRPQMEVDFLMKTYEDFIRSDVKELISRLGIRFSVIGDKSRLSESMQAAISEAENLSHDNKGMHLILAISYGGRNEIVEAVKKIARKVEDGIVEAKEIDESMMEQHLMSHVAEYPNLDLLIRPGGEVRVSNFMLWQMSYAELYFTDTLFPDFGEAAILEALAAYSSRNRRYGLRSS